MSEMCTTEGVAPCSKAMFSPHSPPRAVRQELPAYGSTSRHSFYRASTLFLNQGNWGLFFVLTASPGKGKRNQGQRTN